MSDKIIEMQKKLKDLGYFASEELSKIVVLFENSGKREKKSIPTLLLQGKSGAGKTFLAETFSEMIGAHEEFVQCFPRMGTENFQYDVNIEGVMKNDSDNSIKKGILLNALEKSYEQPVVLIVDELDKARPEVDSFLLDFLENGRVTTGTDTYEKGKLDVMSLQDMQRLSNIENNKMEFELPDLQRCRMGINTNEDVAQWVKILKENNPNNFKLYADENNNGKIYVDIDTIEQLEVVCEKFEFGEEYDYERSYKGWFEYSMSDYDLEKDNIMWAENKSENDGTRFGIKIDEDKMFRIAMNRGTTFVYLDSRDNTLEKFLGKDREQIQQYYRENIENDER